MKNVELLTNDEKCVFQSRSQDRITWGVELSKGFDRLKYGLHVEWSSESFLDLLGEYKREAQKNHVSLAVDFEELPPDSDHQYNMHTTGRSGGYAFHISRADVHIFFSVRKDYMSTPNVWVDIGSLSCWSPGYQSVIELVNELVIKFGGIIRKIGVSEVHLCADCIGLEIEDLDLNHYSKWITRANKFNSYADRTKLTGIRLDQSEGRLGLSNSEYDLVGYSSETGLTIGQGDIALRIYDKTVELKYNSAKQSVFASVWQKPEFDNQPVTRVEFQLRRPVLRQLGVDSLTSLFSKLSGLWKYCTEEWARFSIEPVDRNNRHQDRAVIHPWWQVIQSLEWGDYIPVRRKRLLPQKDKYQLADQMIGCALNLAAIDRCDLNPHRISIYLQAEVESWCRKKALEINPKTGESLLIEKMKIKINEVWPNGYCEVHGPEAAFS